jgi:hypothetical protein
MVDAISRSAWVGSVQGSATHHRPRGSPAGALDPTRGAALQPPAARRASALSRQVPEASRLLVGLLPGLRMAVGFPLGPSGLSTQGVRVPVSARARCHQAQPGRAERCEARGGYSRSARWPPPFTPTRNRRCHASAVRRRPPRRWPEFLHETLPSRREIARLARRLEPQGIEAISVRATASASAAMAANSSSRFNAPEPPVADYPTPDASNPRRPGRPPVRRQVTAVAGAPPSHVATRGPIYATASIDTNRAAAGAGS